MNCDEVRKMTNKYEEEQLPELLSKRIEAHLDTCQECNPELSLTRDGYMNLQLREDFSVVNKVMARINKDQKWALPVSKQMVRLSRKLKMTGVALAAMLFIVFSSLAVLAPGSSDDLSAVDGEWVKLKATQTISAIEPIDVDSHYLSDSSNESNSIVASIDDPIFYSDNLTQDESQGLNLVVAGSLLGILITLITVNWLVRV